MTLDLTTQKSDLRRRLREEIKAIAPEERRRASLAAADLLRRQTIWRDGQTILFYAATTGELDLTILLEEALAAGKTVALPAFVADSGAYDAFVVRHLANDCVSGKFGILEPKPDCPRLPLNRLDLILVPGVAFDVTGQRLGRGQGFYDRLLAGVTAVKCGVAFDLQIAEQIPAETHDIRMNCLLTPTRWRQLSP
jgi:5-formyltetrahydrofolate cyclo-ligase